MEHEEKKNGGGLARLLEIAGERKWLLVLAGVLSGLSALCMLVPYWSVYELIKLLILNFNADAAISWGVVALVGLVAGLVFLYASLIASHTAAFRTLYGLRLRLSEHIGRLPLGFLSNSSTGAIKKTLDQNVEKIEIFIAHTIPDLVNVVVTIVVSMVIFFSVNGWMAMLCLGLLVASIVIQFSTFFSKKTKALVGKYFDAQECLSGSAVQYVRGMPVVKIFGHGVTSFRQFTSEIEDYKRYALQVCDSYQWGMIVFSVILNSMTTFLLPVGLLLWTGSAQSVATAVAWIFFLVMGPGVVAPVYKLLFLGGNLQQIDEGVARLDAIFSESPLPEPVTPKAPGSFDVEFRNVSFAYKNEAQASRTDALSDVSFIARQGHVTALVGPSGSGKTTVANLIPRFWDVASGEVLIGGVNVKSIATEKLMGIVSFVFQDTFLFDDSVFNNIAAAKPGASREDVVSAAKAAQCHEFIMRLPHGYDTMIGGKGGQYLSGGEAQRLCVARAILKDAPILVLDEATAFADPENEQKIQKALSALVKGKTVIVIAHRLASIAGADNIVVLDKGRVAQTGRHDDLRKPGGLYARMWDAYSNASNWQL